MCHLMLLGAVVCAVAPSRPAPESLRLTGIVAEPVPVGKNLIREFGFERVGAGGAPEGWRWDRRNTDATCTVDESVAHSGRRSVKFTNGTPFGAHVYGMLTLAEPIRLQPGRTYTYSAWVRSEDPGALGLITGSGWQFRAYAPKTGSQWRRIWVTFTPSEADAECILRISTESPTRGVWVDDVKLEEGAAPTPVVDEGSAPAWSLDALTANADIEKDGQFSLPFLLASPVRTELTVRSALTGARSRADRLNVEPGVWRLVVRGAADGAGDASRTLSVAIGGAPGLNADLKASMTVRFLSPRAAAARLDRVASAMPGLRRLLARVRAAGQDPSYPLTTMTVLENFIPCAREDLAHGETRRALYQVADMERMAARVRSAMEAVIGGKRKLPPVPRYTAASRPTVVGGVFRGSVRWPDGRNEERPIFFNGFGHFGQVVADMEKWPGYGVNVIQVEFGPSSVFPSEGVVDDAAVRHMREVLDRAQKAGVAVCLLISPHYFPGWALEKWPELRKRREGFLGYCLHAPEGQELLKRFIRTALPPLAHHPALHSICLSNEPVNVEEPCEAGRRLWIEWLERRHGTVETMNRRWGTNYRTIDEVPLPDPFGPRPDERVWVDYVRFNQEFFAGWHRMLADTIHEIAPDLPVHAKAMTWTLVNDGDISRYGVDATLFASFSQINGNDSVNLYSFGEGEFAQSWVMNAMGHQLQRSVLDAPVFNTENHLISDRDTRYVPASHIRTALWQAAIYGQGATTIWVWERTFDPRSDFAGSIMHRPECAEAVGIVNHDLNRAAEEIAAFQQAPPQVCLLHSTSGAVRDMGPHGDSLQKAFVALTLSGVRCGFITERQLEAGIMPPSSVLIVPHIRHLSDAAFATLKGYSGRVVMMGEGDMLAFNEWGEKRSDRLPRFETLPYRYGPTQWRQLRSAMEPRLGQWGVRPSVRLMEGAKPAEGVEWRTVDTRQGTLVNLCSQRQMPVRLSLQRDGKPVDTVDVLNGQPVTGPFTLRPLEVRLLRLRR